MSQEMKRRIEQGQFLDNSWVARYTVSFANFYRKALTAFEAGDRDAIPKSWRISFETSIADKALVMQDLLLGVNAHINHDLALSLTEVSIDPDRGQRYQDHTAVNAVLEAITDAVQDLVSRMYAPGLATLDACAGRFDEIAAGFSIAAARESAWEAAVALANARNDLERSIHRKCLDARSAVLARLLLAPNVNPALIAVLRQAEQGAPWWEWVKPPTNLCAAAAPLP